MQRRKGAPPPRGSGFLTFGLARFPALNSPPQSQDVQGKLRSGGCKCGTFRRSPDHQFPLDPSGAGSLWAIVPLCPHSGLCCSAGSSPTREVALLQRDIQPGVHCLTGRMCYIRKQTCSERPAGLAMHWEEGSPGGQSQRNMRGEGFPLTKNRSFQNGKKRRSTQSSQVPGVKGTLPCFLAACWGLARPPEGDTHSGGTPGTGAAESFPARRCQEDRMAEVAVTPCRH